MPLVGNKHFKYTDKGMKDALAYAQKTGQKVKVDKKALGGMVKKYAYGGQSNLPPEQGLEGMPAQATGRERFSRNRMFGMPSSEGRGDRPNIESFFGQMRRRNQRDKLSDPNFNASLFDHSKRSQEEMQGMFRERADRQRNQFEANRQMSNQRDVAASLDMGSPGGRMPAKAKQRHMKAAGYANGGVVQPIEYDESTPRVGGERSAWFPEGQFFGMDVPEGSSNIANILAGVAMGGVGGAGRKSLHGMAKNIAAKRLATRAGTKSLSNEILKSGVKAKEAGPHLYNKGMISEGSMGKLSHQSKDLIKQNKKVADLMNKADKRYQSELKSLSKYNQFPLGSTPERKAHLTNQLLANTGVYRKANYELAKLSEMKRNVDMHNVWKRAKVTPSEVGEVASVGRRASTGVVPAAVRGEVTRRMGSDSYQQGGALKGPSHKQGGIPAIVGGNEPIEMEGGEYIIKRKSAKKLGPDILNYINKTGSVPKMNEGGETNPYIKQYKESMGDAPTYRYTEEMIKAAPTHKPSDPTEYLTMTKYDMKTANKFTDMAREAKARSLKDKFKEEIGISGGGNLATMGALRDRGHRKAAARYTESLANGGYSNGTNPYIQQYEEYMANVPTESYSREQIRNAPAYSHQTRERAGVRNLTQDQMKESNEKQWERRQAERGARARELMKDEQVLSGNVPMSLFGALRRRGHRKAAARHASISEKKKGAVDFKRYMDDYEPGQYSVSQIRDEWGL